ncbi:glycosyltransferase family 2 protein [Nitrospina gracilis]|uniref:glycosyltransferase family 2 protein n=1 Tax=Nitrospina gracilis TaxID=35801 RepID=UPI001F327D50|nr:glycosyltransferase family 2 protein [Nitrospina gracilis]MCF8721511.1 glycosyltransferase involved in cell wall biosynthesis [Nitrospina gracilis Nb-211]
MLSVILITKNEAPRIRQCLESVRWADEIVVLDSGSTDGTPDICREYTEQVFDVDWPGFGPQKNRALDRATGDWILSIDADEVVTDALRDEIERTLRKPKYNGYKIPRSSHYVGRRIRHSGWTPDYVVRLMKKGSGGFTNSLVHEKLEIAGKVGRLKNPLIHYSFDTFEDVIDKMNRYSTYNAQMLYEQDRDSSLMEAVGRGLWAFVRTYILKRGFLDGRQGFQLAVSNAEGTYYKYVKLMELHRRKRSELP